MALVTSAPSLTLRLHQELHSGGGSFLCPLWATVTRLVSPMQPCPLCSHTLPARCLSAGGLAGRKRHLSSPPPLGGSLSHFSIEYLLEVLPPLQASTGYIPFSPLPAHLVSHLLPYYVGVTWSILCSHHPNSQTQIQT